MQLEHDHFVISYDQNQASEEDLIATVKKAGYKSIVVVSSRKTKGAKTPAPADDPLWLSTLERAKKEMKPIVLDFHAGWCIPCKKMDKVTFSDERVQALLSQSILVKVDTDKHPDLARSFGVVGLPDIRLLNSEGKELQKLRGFQSPDQMKNALRSVLPKKE